MDINASHVLSFVSLFFSFVVACGVLVIGISLKRILKLSDDKEGALEKRVITVEGTQRSFLEKLLDSFVSKSICEKQSLTCIGNFNRQFSNGMDQFKEIKIAIKDLIGAVNDIKVQNAKNN